MKKNFIYVTAALAVFAMASCGSNSSEAGSADSSLSASDSAATYTITEGSTLGWGGSKVVGVGAHAGTIAISEGSISVENGNITAGNFTIDMKKIVVSDSAMPDEYKQKLIGHFSADDFFNTEKFPTAKFEITAVKAEANGENTHVISGNLTLRDSTKNINIPAAVSIADGKLTAKGTTTINRLDWGVNYDKASMSLTEKAQAALKNGVVSKDITISFDLTANKK
jgi:polyisoprenoid-binding protein YceI